MKVRIHGVALAIALFSVSCGDSVPGTSPDDVGGGTFDTGSDTGLDIGDADDDATDSGCTAASECDDGNDCTSDSCGADGQCENDPIEAGEACGDGGDVCDGAGACIECIDTASGSGRDAGCAAATPVCSAGACVACTDDDHCAGDMVCDGGTCIGCQSDDECDDGLSCTNDACDGTTGLCVFETADSRCDDGLFCNGAESCAPDDDAADADGCAAGPPPARADGITCTTDTCDEEADSIVHTANDGACDDGNPCSINTCDLEVGCVAEAAEAGTLCDGGAGICEGTSCADCADTAEGTGTDQGCGGGSPFCVDGACVNCLSTEDCGPNQTCDGGTCVGCTGHADCDDGVPCTVDACNSETTVCSYTPSHVTCDDGAFCNGTEQCNPQVATADADGCAAGVAPTLDDGIACTVDYCDGELGRVVNSPDHGACDDGNECTVDTCSRVSGCVSVPVDAGGACDGGDGVCDGAGACAACVDDQIAGIDAGCTVEAPSCDDGTCIVCTAESDACPLDCEGTPDGPASVDACGVCDTDDTNNCIEPCDGGSCVACDGTDPLACDDLNPCTADSCVDGFCVNDGASLDGVDCVDADACTVESSCSDGVCAADLELACDGPCHTGVCDPLSGCALVSAGTSCDDGDDTTIDDVCSAAGVCAGVCHDHNPCTFDITPFGHGAGACPIPTPLPEGFTCDRDDDPCTDPVCDGAGTCTPQVAPACVDCEETTCEGQCLTGECTAEDGCATVTVGTSCDDGSDLTVNDACNSRGQCIGQCPERECGSWFRGLNGECIGVNLSFGDSLCPEPEDPCMASICTLDGRCEVVPRDEGASCQHPCGGGECSAGGVCELTRDDCGVSNTHCWQSSCDLETNECVRASDDPGCLFDTAVCDTVTRTCNAGVCGDGYCSSYCSGTAPCYTSPEASTCTEDCLPSCGVEGNLCRWEFDKRFNWSGAWRAHQSSAYGWPYSGSHQTESLSQMLTDGIRWLHLVVDYCTPGDDSGPLCLCSGDDLCGLASIPLEPRLTEIHEWMLANPSELVVLLLWEFVNDGDLRAAFDRSGAGDLLYERTTFSGNYEAFPMTMNNMATKDRRLVVFGGSFLSLANVHLGTQVKRVPADPGPPNLATPFELPDGDVDWECANSENLLPNEVPGFKGFYALVHSTGTATWTGAACYNQFALDHWAECNDFAEFVHVMFFDFYNASSHALEFGDAVSPYEDRCLDNVQGCLTDDECDSGICGGLFICLTCENNDDCLESQYCDTYFGTCLTDQADGALCLTDASCQSGNCAGLCYSCSDHDDCDDGEWCDAFGGCQPEKSRGFGCVTDVECISGNCFAAFCAECNEQTDCEADEHCNLDILPGESRCVAKTENGGGCISDFECVSGNCHAATCSECDAHDDCGGDRYCTLDIIPPIESVCADKRDEGEGCASHVECTTGTCSAGFICVETCSGHNDCGSGRWCDAGGICQDKSGNGTACLGNVECTSGNCYLGFCVVCDNQNDCAGGTYCNLSTLPGESTCVSKKSNGSGCVSNYECTSGNCHAATCSECDAHGDCGANEYCTLDVVPPINSYCETKKSNGTACGSSVECVSNQCTLFQCGECVNDDHCPANENCNAFNECAPDVGNNAPCLRDAQCTTGICSAGFCAECLNDGHCAANENCDAGGDCAPDVGNNAPCLRHAQCTTGICSAGFCAECTSDSHCPSNEHCDVGGDCIADVGNNAPCTRHAVCSTGICSAGFCAQCTNDSHCSSSQFCNGGGDCQAKLGNGSVCLEHRVCSSGCCGAGFCGGLGC